MNKDIDQITKELKAHFPEEQLEFKVGATNQEKTKGLALAYVQARAIQDRLDDVVGFHNWKVEYKEITGGFLCTLSVRIDGEWITKQDGAPITEFESIKGGISSALKRVASSGWGIGRYLYNAEGKWYPIEKRGKGYYFTISPTLSLKELTISNTEITSPASKVNGAESLSKLGRAQSYKLKSGKYEGFTLIQLYHKDKPYFDFIKDRCSNQSLANAAKYLSKHITN